MKGKKEWVRVIQDPSLESLPSATPTIPAIAPMKAEAIVPSIPT